MGTFRNYYKAEYINIGLLFPLGPPRGLPPYRAEEVCAPR
jgi:hypothetical protein